jgi:hypothetical protein
MEICAKIGPKLRLNTLLKRDIGTAAPARQSQSSKRNESSFLVLSANNIGEFDEC